MVKFVAIYKTPANPEEFERRYREEHLALGRKIPGIQELEILRLKKLMGGMDAYMVVTARFESKEAFKRAAATPEWKAWGENAVDIAGADGFTAFLGEVEIPAGFAGAAAV